MNINEPAMILADQSEGSEPEENEPALDNGKESVQQEGYWSWYSQMLSKCLDAKQKINQTERRRLTQKMHTFSKDLNVLV